jgi:hypothetical protein
MPTFCDIQSHNFGSSVRKSSLTIGRTWQNQFSQTQSGTSLKCQSWRVKFSGDTQNFVSCTTQKMSQPTTRYTTTIVTMQLRLLLTSLPPADWLTDWCISGSSLCVSPTSTTPTSSGSIAIASSYLEFLPARLSIRSSLAGAVLAGILAGTGGIVATRDVSRVIVLEGVVCATGGLPRLLWCPMNEYK